ncbi:MAG: Ig-like domain-containing protein [bacterium]
MKSRSSFFATHLHKLLCLLSCLIPLTSSAQSHFVFKANTEDSYAIVVQSAALNGVPLESGDEIGVFTPAGLCVGASVVRSTSNIPITAWQDDSITPGVEDGYDDGQAISFRVWDVSNQAEFVMNTSYILGNGTFGDGPYAQVILSLQVNFAPRLSLAGAYSFDEDTIFEMNLNDFVSDEDHADATLAWTITGGQNITSARLPGNLARFTPAPDWFGAEAFTFIARDPQGASDTAHVTMEVLAVQDRPAPARLLSPIGDARVDTLNVALHWQASVDPDGEALSYLVIYGTVRTLTAQVDSGRTSNTAFAIPDDFIKPGRRYYWQVITFDGFTAPVPSVIDSFSTIPSTDVAERNAGPLQFDLSQNYPNPFSLSGSVYATMIRFSLPQPAFVELDIHNALGQRIANLRRAQMRAGEHEVAWNGVDGMGRKISSGIYWINFSAGAFQTLRKLVVMK